MKVSDVISTLTIARLILASMVGPVWTLSLATSARALLAGQATSATWTSMSASPTRAYEMVSVWKITPQLDLSECYTLQLFISVTNSLLWTGICL